MYITVPLVGRQTAADLGYERLELLDNDLGDVFLCKITGKNVFTSLILEIKRARVSI